MGFFDGIRDAVDRGVNDAQKAVDDVAGGAQNAVDSAGNAVDDVAGDAEDVWNRSTPDVGGGLQDATRDVQGAFDAGLDDVGGAVDEGVQDVQDQVDQAGGAVGGAVDDVQGEVDRSTRQIKQELETSIEDANEGVEVASEAASNAADDATEEAGGIIKNARNGNIPDVNVPEVDIPDSVEEANEDVGNITDDALDAEGASVQDAVLDGSRAAAEAITGESAEGVTDEEVGKRLQSMVDKAGGAIGAPGEAVGEATEGTVVGEGPIGGGLDAVSGLGEFAYDAFLVDPARAGTKALTGINPETGETDTELTAIEAFDLATIGAGAALKGAGKAVNAGKSAKSMGLFTGALKGSDEAASAVDDVASRVGRLDPFNVGRTGRRTVGGGGRVADEAGGGLDDVATGADDVGGGSSLADEIGGSIRSIRNSVSGGVDDAVDDVTGGLDDLGSGVDDAASGADDAPSTFQEAIRSSSVFDDLGATRRAGDDVDGVDVADDVGSAVDDAGNALDDVATGADDAADSGDGLFAGLLGSKPVKYGAGGGLAAFGLGAGGNLLFGGGPGPQGSRQARTGGGAGGRRRPGAGGGGGGGAGGRRGSGGVSWQKVEKTDGGCVIMQAGGGEMFLTVAKANGQTVAVDSAGETVPITQSSAASDLPTHPSIDAARAACQAANEPGEGGRPVQGDWSGELQQKKTFDSGWVLMFERSTDGSRRRWFVVGKLDGRLHYLEADGQAKRAPRDATGADLRAFEREMQAISAHQAWREANEDTQAQPPGEDPLDGGRGEPQWSAWERSGELPYGWYRFTRTRGDQTQYAVAGNAGGRVVYLAKSGKVKQSRVILPSKEAVAAAIEAFQRRRQDGQTDPSQQPSGSAPPARSIPGGPGKASGGGLGAVVRQHPLLAISGVLAGGAYALDQGWLGLEGGGEA